MWYTHKKMGCLGVGRNHTNDIPFTCGTRACIYYIIIIIIIIIIALTDFNIEITNNY